MVQFYSNIVSFKMAAPRVRLRRSAPVSIPLLFRMQPGNKHTYFFSPITAKAQKLLNCMRTAGFPVQMFGATAANAKDMGAVRST
jgi:hypothetical protein